MKLSFAYLGVLGVLLAALAGCGGDDGAPGPAGEKGDKGDIGLQGPEGPPGTGASPASATGNLVGDITDVKIDAATGITTVTFSVKSEDGLPVTGATSFEFTAAKLIPATATKPAYWQSYINRSTQATGGARVLRAAGERRTATEVKPGEYTYSFCTSLTAAASFKYYGSGTEPAGSCESTAVGRSGVLDSTAATPILAGLNLAYEANATHRIGISGRSGARYNAVIDFVPAQLPELLAVKSHQVVTNESCGSCHAADSSNRASLEFAEVHGNSRFDVNLCANCHNPSTFDSEGSTDTAWKSIDMTTMIHKLHGSATGYSVAGRDYSHVTYPQDAPFGGVGSIGAGFAEVPGVMNCRTCHDNQSPKIKQAADRPNADKLAWSTNISKQACGTCHDGTVATAVDFSNHFGNQADNGTCALCHGEGKPKPIPLAHATPYKTPNNPELVAGAKTVDYEIASVTVDAMTHRPTVKFRVLVDGAPLNLKTLPAGGVSIGAVNMKLAWSAPMPAPLNPAHGPAIAVPLDWNNFGTTSGRTYWNNTVSLDLRAYDQPTTVNLSTAGVIASLTGPDDAGYFTTAPGINPAAPLAFPASTAPPADPTLAPTPLRAVAIESYLAINGMNISGKAALKGVDGAENTLRRQIVDIDSCNTCHERVGFHSNAGRMNNPNYCATCHNAEVTSSNIFEGTADFPLADGPRKYAQKPNNFKDMIHSIHAAKMRKEQNPLDPFNFIRGNPLASGGSGPMVFEDVGYPGKLSDCVACHIPGTYGIPANDRFAWSAIDVQPSLVATAGVFTPTTTVRHGPGAAACGSCHSSTAANAHFSANTVTPIGESCNVCHGPGSAFEPHKR